ncbi:hypothetical protein ACP4OV_011793 [Aristida adscensionis]
MAMALRALAGKLRVLPGRAAASRARAFASQKEKRRYGISSWSYEGAQALSKMSTDELLRLNSEETKRLIRKSYMMRLLTVAGGAAFSVLCVSTAIVALAEEEVAKEEVAKEED